jgi:hypothetical protein
VTKYQITSFSFGSLYKVKRKWQDFPFGGSKYWFGLVYIMWYRKIMIICRLNTDFKVSNGILCLL